MQLAWPVVVVPLPARTVALRNRPTRVDEAGFIDAFGEAPAAENPMWPALIAAGGALYGAKKASDSNREAMTTSDARWHREHYYGVHDKVWDAKQAGVHPLFALGANTSSSSPAISVSDAPSHMAQAGQHLARGLQAQATQEQRQLHVANLLALEAQAERDFAHASLYRSEAARAAQSAGAAAAMPPAVVDPTMASKHPMAGKVEVKPAEQLTSKHGEPHLTPATQPGLEAVQFPDGRVELVAPIQADERLGELGQALMLPYLLGHNIRKPLADFYERLRPHRFSHVLRDADRRDRHARNRRNWSKRFPGVRFPSGWDH